VRLAASSSLAAVAVALLLLPGATSVPTSFLGAEQRLQYDINVDAIQERPLSPSSNDPGNLLRACGEGGHGDLERDAGSSLIRFTDRLGEKGCMEASATLRVPAGAKAVNVTFLSKRVVIRDGDVPVTWPVAVQQDLHLALGTTQRASSTVIGSNGNETTLPMRQFHTEAIVQESDWGHALEVRWEFRDLDPNPYMPLPDNLPTGTVRQDVQDIVKEPTVTFLGIPLAEVSATEERRAEGNDQSRQVLQVVLHVERPADGARVGLVVKVPGHLRLESVTSSVGAEVPARGRTVESEANIQHVIVDPVAIANAGYGTFTFTFTGVTPLEPNLAVLALVLVLVALPGVMAGLSVRQWVLLRRQAGTAYPHVAQQYLWAILATQAIYLIVLAWIAVARPFPLIVAWPMESQAVLLLGILLVVTATFFLLAFLAKGRLVRLAEADLAAKRRANLELERSNRDLEQFAYVASHDLQEPLRAVAGYTQLLQHRYGGKLDAQAQQYIRHAVEGADRMQGLIHGLLAYARIGTDAAHLGPVDMAEALGEALGNLEVPLRESTGQVAHGPLPTVHADRAQVVQLLQNLVGNALKFRAPGKAPRIRVEAHATGTGEWTVEVRDNGIGIPPEHQRRIFQIFQRLHPRDRYEGSGLGLAICQRIVERHGGRIWVESRPGQGARFLFTLPKSPERASVA
jgi:signal transduction histidine kinase